MTLGNLGKNSSDPLAINVRSFYKTVEWYGDAKDVPRNLHRFASAPSGLDHGMITANGIEKCRCTTASPKWTTAPSASPQMPQKSWVRHSGSRRARTMIRMAGTDTLCATRACRRVFKQGKVSRRDVSTRIIWALRDRGRGRLAIWASITGA